MQFEQLAQQATLFDYLHEVEHMAARATRLEQAIEEAVQLAPQQMREVIEALQALRGIAKVSAVTIVAELGELSRFGEARQLSTIKYLSDQLSQSFLGRNLYYLLRSKE